MSNDAEKEYNYWKAYQENGYNTPEKGMKFHDGKPRYDLVDDSLLMYVYESLPQSIDVFTVSDAITAISEKDAHQAMRIMKLLYIDVLGIRDVLTEPLTYGAHKYADNNWKRNPKSWYFSAAERHLRCCLNNKEEKDPESGIEHWKLAMANIYFCLWFVREGL